MPNCPPEIAPVASFVIVPPAEPAVPFIWMPTLAAAVPDAAMVPALPITQSSLPTVCNAAALAFATVPVAVTVTGLSPTASVIPPA